MDKVIDKYYEMYNFPSATKLYKYLKEDNVSVTKKQVDEYLSKLEEVQLTKEIKAQPSALGHITAMYPDQIWQIDIYIILVNIYSEKGGEKTSTNHPSDSPPPFISPLTHTQSLTHTRSLALTSLPLSRHMWLLLPPPPYPLHPPLPLSYEYQTRPSLTYR